MTSREKFKFVLRQEAIYLPLALLVAIASYFNYDLQAAVRVFFYTALFFQLVILIIGWEAIMKRNNQDLK